MIRTENFEINGVAFVRTYSDSGRYVVRDGISYDEAIDPAEFNRIYIEGDSIQEDFSNDDMIEDDAEEILDIILGETP